MEGDEVLPDAGEGNMLGTHLLDESHPARRSSRSSGKPRFLFPEARDTNAACSCLTDEEALTDIENPQAHGIADEEPEVPPAVTTPVKKSFPANIPATPPTTVRATRSTARNAAFARAINDSDFGESSTAATDANGSPFGGWPLGKTTVEKTNKGKKREASDTLTPAVRKRQTRRAAR